MCTLLPGCRYFARLSRCSTNVVFSKELLDFFDEVESRPVPLLESMGRRMTSALTFGGSPMNLFSSPQAPSTPNITSGNKRTSAFF